MKGVEYVVDRNGEARAVLIDLKKHGRLWEDFHDLLVSCGWRNESRTPWAGIKAHIRKDGTITK